MRNAECGYEIAAGVSRIKHHKQRNETLEIEKSKLATKIQTLEAQIQTLEAEKSKFVTKTQTAGAHIQTLEARNSEFATKTQMLEARIQVLEAENSKLATHTQTIENENDKMRGTFAEHHKEHELVSAILQALRNGSDEKAATELARLQLGLFTAVNL